MLWRLHTNLKMELCHVVALQITVDLQYIWDTRMWKIQVRCPPLPAFQQQALLLQAHLASFHNCCYRIKRFYFPSFTRAVVAEWLRRWTWNPMGFPRAGSNPAGCENYFSLLKKELRVLAPFIESAQHNIFLKGSLYKHLLKVTNTTLLKRIQSQDLYIRNTLCIYFYIYHRTILKRYKL